MEKVQGEAFVTWATIEILQNKKIRVYYCVVDGVFWSGLCSWSVYQKTIGLVSGAGSRPGYPELKMAENVCDEIVEWWYAGWVG